MNKHIKILKLKFYKRPSNITIPTIFSPSLPFFLLGSTDELKHRHVEPSSDSAGCNALCKENKIVKTKVPFRLQGLLTFIHRATVAYSCLFHDPT